MGAHHLLVNMVLDLAWSKANAIAYWSRRDFSPARKINQSVKVIRLFFQYTYGCGLNHKSS